MPYRNLSVYQKAYQLALEVHRMSLGFPRIEQYELASQMRRSSKSITANIAEGMGKQESPAEVTRYIRLAMGSCDETKVWLEYSKDLGYIEQDTFEHYYYRYDEVGKMLRGIIRRYTKT